MKALAYRPIIFLALLSMLAGCTLVDRTVTLEHAPTARPTEPVGPTVFMIPPVDKRYDPSRIGNVRDGYGKVSASVVTNDDPAVWLGAILMDELRIRGHDIVKAREGELGSGDVAIRLVLKSVVTDLKPNSLTHMAVAEAIVDVEMFRDRMLFRRREYTGSYADDQFGGFATGGDYGRYLGYAVRNLMAHAIPDLDTALRSSYPQR